MSETSIQDSIKDKGKETKRKQMHWLITSWKYWLYALSHISFPDSETLFKYLKITKITDLYYYGFREHLYTPTSPENPLQLSDQIDLILENVFHKVKEPEKAWSSVMTLDEWRDIHERLFTKDFFTATNPIAGYAGTRWSVPIWYQDLEEALTFYLSRFIASIICSILSAIWIYNQEQTGLIWFIWFWLSICMICGYSAHYQIIDCKLWIRRYKHIANNRINANNTFEE